MPGFVDPNEQESRQSLYRDLLSHLNTTIWGSPSTLPRSESNKWTTDFNPVEAFDKSKNPEGLIYAEPDIKWTEAIAKIDAVKMLAKGAKEVFGKHLKRIAPETTAKEGWEVFTGSNISLRENVRDIIRAARNTPQELLTPLKETHITDIARENTLGQYWPKATGRPLSSHHTPRVEVDPSKGGAANTWFHEIIHGRHIDAPFYSKRMDEQTGGDVYRRYLELITNKGARQGEALSEKTGRRFYWENPKELVARDFGSRAAAVPQGELDAQLAEDLYTHALEGTTIKMRSKAPKFTKRIADSIKEDMQKSFPGIDWQDVVKQVGSDRYKVGSSYLGLEDMPLSEINPNWMKDKVKSTINKAEELFKKIDTYAAE